MQRLSKRSALVVGGASGIGRSVATLFATEGADVAVADLGRAAELSALEEALRAEGARTAAFEVDVRSEAQVAAAINGTISAFGKIDILVNNAGISGGFAPFASQGAADWARVLDVNLNGVAYGMRHALPHMLSRRYGRIINTASQLAHKPAPNNAMYCASKAAVVALTASVAMEVAASGVTINAVCPGPTDTAMWRAADPEWNAWKVSTLPIARVGTVEEIAWAYVYLASDEAAYMIGQSISPNGGDVMW
jgi:NAD(P)-dependent dehydrogenase (short-subunit alcohol dehydrogenase family)